MDCLFCKIAEGEIPADIVYQDDDIVIFDDINPKATHHKVIIPRKHLATLNDAGKEDEALMGKLLLGASMMAKKLGIADDGFRVVMNCNPGGGQTVFHIHAHLLGGRQMNWPPG